MRGRGHNAYDKIEAEKNRVLFARQLVAVRLQSRP